MERFFSVAVEGFSSSSKIYFISKFFAKFLGNLIFLGGGGGLRIAFLHFTNIIVIVNVMKKKINVDAKLR